MTRTLLLALLLSLLLPASACTVAPAKGTLVSLPKERATECRNICRSLDLRLGAVVVIMNHTGCVCEVAARPATKSAITTAGGAAIQFVAQQQQQEQQRRQQQRR